MVEKRRKKSAGIVLLALGLLIAAVCVSPLGGRLLKLGKLELLRNSVPEDVFSLGRRNEDALDFVFGWKDGIQGSYDPSQIVLTAEETAERVPLLLQWDPRWGYATYGTNYMGLAGCGPTCVSMVSIGLTGDVTRNPLAVARMAEENDWYVSGVGTSWYLMTDGAELLGLYAEVIDMDRESVLSALDAGKLLIASMLPGDFTSSGHFIVISGYEDSGLIVRDPNSPTRSAKLWGYSKLQDQFAQIWAYSLP